MNLIMYLNLKIKYSTLVNIYRTLVKTQTFFFKQTMACHSLISLAFTITLYYSHYIFSILSNWFYSSYADTLFNNAVSNTKRFLSFIPPLRNFLS